MYKVLFPVTHTDSTKAALQICRCLFDNSNVQVYLLTVSKNVDHLYEPDDMSVFLEELKEWFKHAGFTMARSDIIFSSDVAQAICNYANEEQIDYIVMNSSKNRFQELVTFSLSQVVMKRAGQSVMIIKNSNGFLSGHLLRESQMLSDPKSRCLHILIPVENEITVESMAPLLDSTFDRSSVIFHLLYITEIDSGNIGWITTQLNQAKAILLKNKVALTKAGFIVSTVENRLGAFDDTVSMYAEEKEIDLVILVSGCRSGFSQLLFGSVSTRLPFKIKQPILVCKSIDKCQNLIRTFEHHK